MTKSQDNRFLLWVDGVGGYLVLLDDEVVFGPPDPGATVDIPILADLSRRHATLRRDREAYLLCPGRETLLDGRQLEAPTTVTDSNLLQLGAVQLRFNRPHPLSSTARLDFVSRHRTQPSVDGIILLGQTLILGPKPRNHIVCRTWSDDLVLFRQGNELHCRSKTPVKIDGIMQSEGGELHLRSQVSGADFSFSLEPL